MEREYNRTSRCDICKNFVGLTQIEIGHVQPKIEMINDKNLPLLGVCMRSYRDPNFLIGNFIFDYHEICELFEHGFYHEKIGIPCPDCKRGEIAVTRPLKNGNRMILIGCTRYPECRFFSRQIKLKIPCGSCGTALMLSTGEILKCYCPNCQRPLSIPVSLRIWPALLKPQGGCVHFDDEKNCSSCEASRTQRKSLLDLELPLFVDWYKCKKEEKLKKETGITLEQDQSLDWEDERDILRYTSFTDIEDHRN